MTASWVYLLLAVWGALWTLVSFRPPTRPPIVMALGFFASWSTTEAAPIHLVVQVAGTAVFAWFGAFSAWPGWVGLVISLGSWAALGASIKGSFRTRSTFEAAFDDALGAGWRATITTHAPEARRLEWSRVWLPFRFKRREVRRVRNLSYDPDGSKKHRLDVYHRADTPAGAPVLLQIPGGAWMISNKDQQAMPLLYRLAADGWVCVAINYRLSPKATWPEHVVDCKRALAWVREHVAEYGGNPDAIVVTGGSAGGHLTALLGLTANDPEWQPGFEDADTTVQAMVPFYGVYDWTNRYRLRTRDGLDDILRKYVVKRSREEAPDVYDKASPCSHLRPDAPPALIVHGDLDTLAPVAEARKFAADLRAISHSPVVYVELAGAHHAFEVFNSIRTLQTVAAVEEYLAWVVSAAAAAASGVAASGARSQPAAGPTRSSGPADGATDPRSTGRTAH